MWENPLSIRVPFVRPLSFFNDSKRDVEKRNGLTKRTETENRVSHIHVFHMTRDVDEKRGLTKRTSREASSICNTCNMYELANFVSPLTKPSIITSQTIDL